MKYLKSKHLFPKVLFVITISVIYSCSNKTATFATQPTLTDYSVGETWTWKYKGVTSEGEVRSDGKDTRVIVSVDGGLGMVIGNDTIPVADMVKPEKSETPKYKWPLKVGEKWKYENNWTSQDGTTGKQSQDAEILSFREEKVDAGTFMAYTIQYKGTVSNSRGYRARTDEVWLYAPEIKNFIYMTQIQEGFSYTEELIEYSK